MTTPHPSIGDWYRLHGGESFEIVAVDDDGLVLMNYDQHQTTTLSSLNSYPNLIVHIIQLFLMGGF